MADGQDVANEGAEQPIAEDSNSAANITQEASVQNEEASEKHREASHLGRKVSHVTGLVETLAERLDRLADIVESSHAQSSHSLDDGMGGDPTEYITKADLRTFEQRKTERDEVKRKEAEASNLKYQSTYLKHVKSMIDSEEDPELGDKLFEALTKTGSPYNIRRSYTSDPLDDVERNFFKAKVELLQSGKKSKANPLKGTKPDMPVGVGGGTNATPNKAAKLPPLPPDAEAYVKSRGVKEEVIRRASLGR